MAFKRLISLLPLVALLTACASTQPVTGASHPQAPVAVEPAAEEPVVAVTAPAAEEIVAAVTAPPIADVEPLPIMASPAPVVAPEAAYVVHVGVVEEQRSENWIKWVRECPGPEVEVLFDLERPAEGDEILAFELEGFEGFDTGCLEEVFTILLDDYGYEE